MGHRLRTVRAEVACIRTANVQHVVPCIILLDTTVRTAVARGPSNIMPPCFGFNSCIVSGAGVIKYLMQVYDLSAIEFRGASAGALISCLAACQARRNCRLHNTSRQSSDYWALPKQHVIESQLRGTVSAGQWLSLAR